MQRVIIYIPTLARWERGNISLTTTALFISSHLNETAYKI